MIDPSNPYKYGTPEYHQRNSEYGSQQAWNSWNDMMDVTLPLGGYPV